MRGGLIRDGRVTAGALARALLEPQDFVSAHPDEAVALFAAYSPTLRGHTHQHHPEGDELRQEIALYADEQNLVQIMRPATDTQKFAATVYADVLSA